MYLQAVQALCWIQILNTIYSAYKNQANIWNEEKGSFSNNIIWDDDDFILSKNVFLSFHRIILYAIKPR